MDSKTTIQHDKLMQLENSMLRYGIYNEETLEKLINTVHNIHKTTSLHERLFTGQQSSLMLRSLYANSLGLHHYSINSLLYLRTVQDKYIALYRELITKLHLYTSAIRILAEGYLPISLVTPSKLREILKEVKKALQKTNPDYDLVIDRLHLYYNMQLVIFGIDKNKNLIMQFPVFIQPYTQQPLILYLLETVPVPIINQNTQAQSYMHLQVNKPYIALNSETYISIRQQGLRTCKRIGYEFYCKELFIAKHKSKYSFESVIYFNLDAETIKENCEFKFLGNCGIEVENHFLLKSLAVCPNVHSKLTIYFTVNTSFVNYLDKFPNVTESLELLIAKNRTTFELTLPISLNISNFDRTLLTPSSNLKEFINSYTNHK